MNVSPTRRSMTQPTIVARVAGSAVFTTAGNSIRWVACTVCGRLSLARVTSFELQRNDSRELNPVVHTHHNTPYEQCRSREVGQDKQAATASGVSLSTTATRIQDQSPSVHVAVYPSSLCSSVDGCRVGEMTMPVMMALATAQPTNAAAPLCHERCVRIPSATTFPYRFTVRRKDTTRLEYACIDSYTAASTEPATESGSYRPSVAAVYDSRWCRTGPRGRRESLIRRLRAWLGVGDPSRIAPPVVRTPICSSSPTSVSTASTPSQPSLALSSGPSLPKGRPFDPVRA